MGQYYKAIVLDNKGNEIVYEPKVKYNEEVTDENGNKTIEEQVSHIGVKLMEHSYFGNYYVESICKLIYKNPSKVAWVGDYSNNIVKINGLDYFDLTRLCNKAHESEYNRVLFYDGFCSKGKLLVNHNLNIYIDLNHFFEQCVDKEGWCIHPLPLLTVLGNGESGSDYYGCNEASCGNWAYDIISIEDEIPDFYQQVYETFKEGR